MTVRLRNDVVGGLVFTVVRVGKLGRVFVLLTVDSVMNGLMNILLVVACDKNGLCRDVMCIRLFMNFLGGGGGDFVDNLWLVNCVFINVLVVNSLLGFILMMLWLVSGILVMDGLVCCVFVVNRHFSSVLVMDGLMSFVLMEFILVMIRFMGGISLGGAMVPISVRVFHVADIMMDLSVSSVFVKIPVVNREFSSISAISSLVNYWHDGLVNYWHNGLVNNWHVDSLVNYWRVSSLVANYWHVNGIGVGVMRGDSMVDGSTMVGGCGVVGWNTVLHLTTKEDLGERKTNRVTKLIEMLVLPLSFSIHNFVMDILAVNNKIVLDMEDKVPRVCESLGHFTEFIEIGTNSSLAFFELVGNIVDNVTHIFNSMEH